MINVNCMKSAIDTGGSSRRANPRARIERNIEITPRKNIEQPKKPRNYIEEPLARTDYMKNDSNTKTQAKQNKNTSSSTNQQTKNNDSKYVTLNNGSVKLPEITQYATTTCPSAIQVKGDIIFDPNAKSKGSKILDGMQLGLDIAGNAPAIGNVADIVNTGISLARGNYADAALSGISAIPFIGYAGTVGKVAKRTAGVLDTVGDIAKSVNRTVDVIDTATDIAKAVDKTVDAVDTATDIARVGKKNIDDLLAGLNETTRKNGIARNFESSGGYKQTLKDFDDLNPIDVKNIDTKYGSGKTGLMKNGTKITARQDSKTGGATLDIIESKKRIYKIRY